MDDVVQRLRAGLEVGAIDLADIMDAADEIERLRHGAAVSDNCVAGNQPEIPCHVTEPMPVVVSGSGSVTPVPYAKHDEKRVDWHTAGGTNHDAVPEAKAMHTRDCSGVLSGTGDTPEPVAWAVVYPNNEVAVIAFKRQDAEERASASDRIVPLYRHPQPTLTDTEREALFWFTGGRFPVCPQHLATIRNLMDRFS